LVKQSSGNVIYADAGDDAIGVNLTLVASGGLAAVETLNFNGTIKMIADGAILVDANLYTANDGKVSDSVSGRPIGVAKTATSGDGEPIEVMPFPRASGDYDSDKVVFVDDFFKYDLDESGSNGVWVTDANDSGAVSETDAHGGVISLAASDTAPSNNDEIYVVSNQEIYKPAAGAFASFKFRVQCTEAAANGANIVCGLTSDTADVADLLGDDGAGPQDSGTHILAYKLDGGAVWRGSVRDTALDDDVNIGAFTTATWHEVGFTVYAAAGATTATVTFFVDGVAGGTKDFTISSATEMRMVFGIKAGTAAAYTLLVDKVFASFDR
jgi:hypothetical protein